MPDPVVYNPVFGDDDSCCSACENHENCMQAAACEKQHASENTEAE